MLPAAKRFTLPFSPQRGREPLNPEVEEAAVYALAELERLKGGGLFLRQPEEKLVWLSKIGYPLWLYPKNEFTYIFDGLKNTQFNMFYAELPSAQDFLNGLSANGNTRGDYAAFLSDHSNFFSRPKKTKQLSVKDMIVDGDFKKEFNVYRREAVEVTGPVGSYGLLSPSLEEAAVSVRLTEIVDLQAAAKEDLGRFSECMRLLNRETSGFVTELNYAAEAVRDEANAKIKAQQEFINPKIAALNSDCKKRIANLSRSFDQEIEKLAKAKAKSERSIESDEGKIRLYQREADAQASKNHLIYEKRWKQKSAQTKKELDGYRKEVKRAEISMDNLTKQKRQQTLKLQLELEAEVERLRKPLEDLAAARNAKILVFKQESDRLLKLEKPVLEALAETIKQAEAVNVEFTALGIVDSQFKSPALFYVPFYVACYEAELSRRFMFLPPSNAASDGFASRLKSLGKSRIKQLVTPRFEAISGLIGKAQELARRDVLLEGQIRGLGERGSVLGTPSGRARIADGLLRLRGDGWVSDKEYNAAKARLA